MDKPHEIRLVRREVGAESELKQCGLSCLDLATIAEHLRKACGQPEGTFTAATLAPRLHILGHELAEGFFADGIVLVEGRSDKSALNACARMMGIDFQEAGIAVLSAEGKNNLDKPFAIFRELGIPIYVVWDCDRGKESPAANLALLRLAHNNHEIAEAPAETIVAQNYAHFEDTLEKLLIEELGAGLHQECLTEACEPFGLVASKETQKNPEVMLQTLVLAKAKNGRSKSLENLVEAIWLHLTGKDVRKGDNAESVTAEVAS